MPELPASARTWSVSQVKQPEEVLYSEGVLCLPLTHWCGLRLLCSSNHWCSAILLFLLLSLQVSLLGQDICADTAAVVSVNCKGSNKRRTWLGKQFFDWDESITSNKIFFGMIPVFFCRLAELIVSYLWPKNCFSKTSLLWICSQERWNTEFQLHAAGADVHEFPSFTPLFLSLFFLLKVQDRFSIPSLSQTFYNHYQVAESPLLPPNTRHGGFYLILCASFPRRKASSKTWCAGTKLAAGLGRTCAGNFLLI